MSRIVNMRFREFDGERFVSLASLSSVLDKMEEDSSDPVFDQRETMILRGQIEILRKIVVATGATITMQKNWF